MLEKGKKVGEYVLLGKLGAGSFGEVWKAEKRTELSVSYFALKFFRPKDDDAIDLEIVKKEVRTWQSLSGLQNVISVSYADKFEEYVYIVSDYAEGGSLEKWLKQRGGKAASPEEAVAITRQILQGLEGMHGEGFVHRDLKPANILIKRGVFYLADFGISRQMKTHSKTTGTAGTYEFMPPEAFEKNPSVSVHTDIWATGAILQKLLTGSLPFPQDEIPSLMAAILMSDPEPLPETVPPALKAIVAKSLQKKREDRFQSASEMREALRNALTPSKIASNHTVSQAETIFLENSEKITKLEVFYNTLAKHLKIAQKPFPLSWVLFWADQLLDSLWYLHSQEPPVIHGDINPQNLKLTDENDVILLNPNVQGSVVGCLSNYMPIEQFRGTGISPRSDIYSLSATLYELLTNVVPPDAVTRANAMLNGKPDPVQPISKINSEVSKIVSDIILKGMTVSQDFRYTNTREMQREFRDAYRQLKK